VGPGRRYRAERPGTLPVPDLSWCHVNRSTSIRAAFPSRFGRSKGDAPHEETAPTVATTAYLPTLSLPLQGGDLSPTVSAQGNALSSRKARRPPPSLSPRKGRKRGVERKWCQVKGTHSIPSSCPSPSGEGTRGPGVRAGPVDRATGAPAVPGPLAVRRLGRCWVCERERGSLGAREICIESAQTNRLTARRRERSELVPVGAAFSVPFLAGQKGDTGPQVASKMIALTRHRGREERRAPSLHEVYLRRPCSPHPTRPNKKAGAPSKGSARFLC
jgi:hypothetical protein